MNFVALLLGLAVERLLTHLFHLREFRWLDPWFDRGFHRLENVAPAVAILGVALIAAVVVVPVGLVTVVLMDGLLQIPYFLFAILVLLFSLGPRDLKEEVDDYAAAAEAGDQEGIHRVARELLETEPSSDPATHIQQVEKSIFVQANNRVFGVVFWFVVLGPTGAWMFRILDLMRRRLAYRYDDPEHAAYRTVVVAVRSLHGVLAWVPARMLAVGYALAGSFEDAVTDWRAYYQNCAPRFFDVTNDVVGCTGCGAIGQLREDEGTPVAALRARAAMGLVIRTLWLIWCPVIAVLTLYNWLT